jgi:hypothetical protein
MRVAECTKKAAKKSRKRGSIEIKITIEHSPPSLHRSIGARAVSGRGVVQVSNAGRREGVDSGCSVKHFYNILVAKPPNIRHIKATLLLQAIDCDCQIEKSAALK